MSDEWARLSFKRFTPAEAEAVTGYTPDLQRKWIERYFDFPDASWHWGIETERSHRRYKWSGLQMICVFGEVMADLGSEVARSALLQETPPNLRRTSDIFQKDWRDRDMGDLFMIRWLDREDHPYFTTTNLRMMKTVLSSHWAGRTYLYNISAMQRRLAAHTMDILQLVTAPA